MNDYLEMTAEQYRQKITEAFEKVEDVRILRYFCIFIFEKLARIYNVKGGAENE